MTVAEKRCVLEKAGLCECPLQRVQHSTRPTNTAARSALLPHAVNRHLDAGHDPTPQPSRHRDPSAAGLLLHQRLSKPSSGCVAIATMAQLQTP